MTAKPTPYDLNLPFGIGSTIAGKYRVDKVLGAGGMGYVFAGMHVALGQKVAIKVLKPTAHNPEFVARFEREARAAARLRSERCGDEREGGHESDERGHGRRSVHRRCHWRNCPPRLTPCARAPASPRARAAR